MGEKKNPTGLDCACWSSPTRLDLFPGILLKVEKKVTLFLFLHEFFDRIYCFGCLVKGNTVWMLFCESNRPSADLTRLGFL